jgi:hypothetical protein
MGRWQGKGGNGMTYLEAAEIKADFTVAMQFADYEEKSRAEALAESAEKYSRERLAEAYAVLVGELDKEKETLKALFVFAIRSRIDTEED